MGQPHRPLRVGMVGHAFMGAAHTQGWAGAGRFFPLQDAVRDSLGAGSLETAVEVLARQVRDYTERGGEDDVALLVFELPVVASPAVVPR